ncbi:MAG: DUF4056 domain-containing protein [Candidatus Nanoarchaeia archaeon]
MKHLFMKSTILLLLFAIIIFATGCITGTPRGMEWEHLPVEGLEANPRNLAPYGSPLFDGNGIVYTKYAGTLDIVHIYSVARKTIEVYDFAYNELMNNKTSFSVNKMDVKVFNYPADWSKKTASEKKRACQETALELCYTIGFHSSIYDELHQLWGFGGNPNSAFSWENMYSNIVGAAVGIQAKALQEDKGKKPEESITQITQKFVNDYLPISSKDASKVVKSLKGKYWKDDILHKKVLVKNLDIGTNDNTVDITPIPALTKSPTKIKTPLLDFADLNGFGIKIYVSQNAPQYQRAKKLLNLSQPIEISDHAKLMELLKKQFIKDGYTVFD